MGTESVGGGLSQSQLDATLATGGWKAIVRTPEQQAEHDAWVAETMAQSAAERRQRRDEAMRNPVWRTIHWAFQTDVWRAYKADQAADQVVFNG